MACSYYGRSAEATASLQSCLDEESREQVALFWPLSVATAFWHSFWEPWLAVLKIDYPVLRGNTKRVSYIAIMEQHLL
jgi:hypothetical protein